jgi:hypothetical protein
MKRIIGLCGYIGAGKSTVAQILAELSETAEILNFADALKDVISAVFGWDRTLLNGDTSESRAFREAPDKWWSERLKMNITPRFIMQNWGTELIRDAFHPDIWAAVVERKIMNSSAQTVIIADCRFINEIDLIKRLGGVLILVQRDGANGASTHKSEHEWEGAEIDAVIKNSGNMDDLRAECVKWVKVEDF